MRIFQSTLFLFDFAFLVAFGCKPAQVETSARDESREGRSGDPVAGHLRPGTIAQEAATGAQAAPPSSAVWPVPPAGWTVAQPAPEHIRFYRMNGGAARQSLFLAVTKLSEANISVRFGGKAAPTSDLTRDCAFGVNGGYSAAKQSVSIVEVNGELKSADAQNLVRSAGVAQPTRATFFWDQDSRRAFFHWASVIEGRIMIFETAADPFASGRKGGLYPASHSHSHSLALGAGPMLIWQDAVSVTTVKEAFDSGIYPDQPQPRSALGITASGYLIVIVADGRSETARGLTLQELAGQLKNWGVATGMNLDGGGSSTFVVAGKVWNRPSEGRERAVWSALCIN